MLDAGTGHRRWRRVGNRALDAAVLQGAVAINGFAKRADGASAPALVRGNAKCTLAYDDITDPDGFTRLDGANVNDFGLHAHHFAQMDAVALR